MNKSEDENVDEFFNTMRRKLNGKRLSYFEVWEDNIKYGIYCFGQVEGKTKMFAHSLTFSHEVNFEKIINNIVDKLKFLLLTEDYTQKNYSKGIRIECLKNYMVQI